MDVILWWYYILVFYFRMDASTEFTKTIFIYIFLSIIAIHGNVCLSYNKAVWISLTWLCLTIAGWLFLAFTIGGRSVYNIWRSEVFRFADVDLTLAFVSVVASSLLKIVDMHTMQTWPNAIKYIAMQRIRTNVFQSCVYRAMHDF